VLRGSWAGGGIAATALTCRFVDEFVPRSRPPGTTMYEAFARRESVMAQAEMSVVIRHIRRLARPNHPEQFSDAELLRAFLDLHDQGAFAAILERYGRVPNLRAPFVLCCLQGQSKAEAAQLLGWKEGTVSGRLARARKLLQGRLTCRGVMLSAALCAASLTPGAAEAAIPFALSESTLQAALQYA